jgi:acetyltransferase-like isoleucine patch superfamily enzyme
MSVLRYQARRLRNAWWGENASIYRRLQKRGRIILGEHTYGEPTIWDFPHDQTKLIAGRYCSLGGNYLLGGLHRADHVTTYPLRINYGLEGAGQDGVPGARGDIIVGNDVWTGYGAWIMPGITIGDGAVIATNAMVTKDVPPYAIVGGTPAKVIKLRHTPEQIEALLEIKWWDWPDEEVIKATPYLASEDIDAFIEYARSRSGS